MTEQEKILNDVTGNDYKFGFQTDIDTDTIPKGLSEEVVRIISAKKEEPEWLTEMRLKAYRHWQTMKMPKWAHLRIPEINYQDIIYYAAPRQSAKYSSMDEVDPELLDTFNKLGIPLEERPWQSTSRFVSGSRWRNKSNWPVWPSMQLWTVSP